ncbi:hypothetical protein QLL95_gp1079 [Cotonvirus japonicus]|uniref:Uncharacterized protein n=1 Tax=Cotonvirus japonicus TaxID=2811091 RepID=A0ABM7NSA8_9VIRU|nr:hypothetical protein QLL95_gp1079 [Cotonvirus japonicus]BCS83044.1 hypothetical protein [Cotonvirus japonicus]
MTRNYKSHKHSNKIKKTSDKERTRKRKSTKKPEKNATDYYSGNDDYEYQDNVNHNDNDNENYDDENYDNENYDDENYDDENYDDENYDDRKNEENNNQEELETESRKNMTKISKKTKLRLKNKINHWLDFDDKIKELNAKMKKYKDAKKNQEELILKIIEKLEMDDSKIDVRDNDKNLRGRVYKHKSVTKGAIKEDVMTSALMEIFKDEKRVAYLVKKIEEKRPVNERTYLKRTKGNI